MQGRSTTLLDILNISLAFLGEDAVTDFSEPESEAGIKVKRLMELTIDEVQRDYLWKELMVTQELSPVLDDEEEPVLGQWLIPNDVLRPMGIRIDLGDLPENFNPFFLPIGQDRYYVEGNVIFTTPEAPLLFSINRTDDPTKWSSELEQCIALGLAAKSAYLVTDNVGLMNSLTTKYEAIVLPKARTLQSKYKQNYATLLPEGFTNIRIRLS